ncbi:MAG TPA: hypothetical protein VJ719_07770 [Chthoniobacterales bacterium]|nr:hypothetical protein [Chthoniobacterales bacterium]
MNCARIGTLWSGFCLMALAAHLSAQTSQIDRAQIARDQMGTGPGPTVSTTGAGESHVVASPNDADLGEQQILKRTEAYQPFIVSVAVPFYWTSNVALTNSGEQSDFLVSPVAAIAYQPRINKNLYGYVGLRQQQFYYDRLPSFNFGSFDAEIGLTYTVPQVYNLVLHAGYDYNRLTEKDSFDAFFQNHILQLSAEMPFRINRAQQLSVGVDSYISMGATPEPPRRHDFSGFVSYSIQVTRALLLNATGRISLHEYVQGSRTDVTELLSVNANYAITKNFSASAMASFAANQSDESVFDYEVADVGGTVAFSLRF